MKATATSIWISNGNTHNDNLNYSIITDSDVKCLEISTSVSMT